MSLSVASVSLALDASVYNTTEGSPSVQVCVSGSVSTGNLSHIGGQSFEVNLTLSDGTALGLCNTGHACTSWWNQNFMLSLFAQRWCWTGLGVDLHASKPQSDL